MFNQLKTLIMYKIYVMCRGRKLYTGDVFYTKGAAVRFCGRMNRPYVKGEAVSPSDYYFIEG